MLQCAAVCCSAQSLLFLCIQEIGCGAELKNMGQKSRTLQHIATHCHTLQHAATRCNTLQYTDVETVGQEEDGFFGLHMPELPDLGTVTCVAVCCSVLQCVAVC